MSNDYFEAWQDGLKSQSEESARSQREAEANRRLIEEFEKGGRKMTREEFDTRKAEILAEVEAEQGVRENPDDTPEEEESPEAVSQDEAVAEEKLAEEPQQPIPEEVEPAWKKLEAQAERFQKKLHSLSSEIAEKEEVVDSLKEQLKVARSELKECNRQLLTLAKGGISEQLELDLPETEPPKVEEENEEAENEEEPSDEWKKMPVTALDLSEKTKEKLAEHFGNCGEVCNWIGSDYSQKIKGLGESARDKIREAIDKIAGVTDEAIRKEAAKTAPTPEKGTLLTMPEDDEGIERDPDKVEEFLAKIDSMVLEGSYFYARDTLSGIYGWVDENKVYTKAQEIAVENIENAPAHGED